MILLLLGGCPAHTQQDLKLAQTHYLLGADYLKKKMPDAAKRELYQAVELDPEHRDAHELLGVIFFMEGLRKVNLMERDQCLKGVAAEEQRAEANKEFRRARKHLRSAVKAADKADKVDSDVLNYLANVAIHFKRYDEAISLAKRALDNVLYASRHLALGTLGWAYFHKGELEAAARELRQSVFHEPKFCVGRFRLAKVHYAKKRYDAAIEQLEKVTGDKSCPIQEAHHLLGLTYMKTKALDQAREQFEQCVKLNPKSCLSEECRRYAKLI